VCVCVRVWCACVRIQTQMSHHIRESYACSTPCNGWRVVCVCVCCVCVVCVCACSHTNTHQDWDSWKVESHEWWLWSIDIDCMCVAVCCSVLQCVAVCCSVLLTRLVHWSIDIENCVCVGDIAVAAGVCEQWYCRCAANGIFIYSYIHILIPVYTYLCMRLGIHIYIHVNIYIDMYIWHLSGGCRCLWTMILPLCCKWYIQTYMFRHCYFHSIHL